MNLNIILKYFFAIYKYKRLTFNFIIQNVISKNSINFYNRKNYCLYTHRYRSVFSSYKMSRYKMKLFFDNRSFTNLNIK